MIDTTPHAAPETLTTITNAIERQGSTLIALSHALHADPEISGEEYRARERIKKLLSEAGFHSDIAQPSAPTALAACYGSGELVVAYCIELDALPGIGHACGHNVNAAAALGAALALAEVADEIGITVLALVTPAEETTGGKVELIREGFFDGVHIAAMAHAAGEDSVGNSSLAMTMWSFTYTGSPAHSAAAPWEGINALDALVIAQNAIALARQQLPPDSVVSLVIDEGGEAINVIPERARGRVEMRSPRSETLDIVANRVRKCLESGAHATDCRLEITEEGNRFSHLEQDRALCLAYQLAMSDRGRAVELAQKPVASTDFGNVSLLIPSLHPMIGYDVHGAVHHTGEFARYGTSESADLAVTDAAYGLAAAIAALAQDPTERARLLTDHGASFEKQ